MSQEIELVGKIGSMALIRREDLDIDYNIFSRLGHDLRPGMIWVSSGATEIGRLDYMRRNGGEVLHGDPEEVVAQSAALAALMGKLVVEDCLAAAAPAKPAPPQKKPAAKAQAQKGEPAEAQKEPAGQNMK